MSSIHTSSPRSNPALDTPAQHATQGGLTQAQQVLLEDLKACASAANSVDNPDHTEFEKLVQAFASASGFEDKSCPEFLDCVCLLLESVKDLAGEKKCSAGYSAHLLSKFFDGGGYDQSFTPIARLPFMTQSPLLEKAVEQLLQGDRVAIHMAVSMIGQRSVSDPPSPQLLEKVLDAVLSNSPDPDDLEHCVLHLLKFTEAAGHASMAAQVAHLCIDRIEDPLTKVEDWSQTTVLCELIRLHPQAQSEAVSKRLGPVLMQMATDAARYDSKLDWDNTFVVREAFFDLLQLPELPEAWKAQAASAAIAQIPMSRVWEVSSAQGFQIRACAYLPDESKGAWVTQFLAMPSGRIDFYSLLQTVGSMQPGENRARLLGMVRESLVAQCAVSDSQYPCKLDLVRLALTIGPGAEYQLVAALLRFDVVDVHGILMESQPSFRDLTRLDEIAIASFLLDPDGKQADPQKPTPGTPFAYPKWLAERRSVLQIAHHGVEAKLAIGQHLPSALAEITQAYAARDWDDLKKVLVASREAR